MKIQPKTQGSGRFKAGYTLVEMMFALAITSFMFFAGMTAITFSRIQLAKDKERAIISDFAVHYLETLRGLPFDSLTKGSPINPLYDGTTVNENGATITLRVPSDFLWNSLSTSDYQSFAVDLLKISHRNPQMRLDLITVAADGVDRVKTVRIEIAWNSPIGYGTRRTMRMDMVRLKDIETKE